MTSSKKWYINLLQGIKWKFFQSIAISLLLYGCTTWTLIKYLKQKLDGIYIRILCAVLNKFWKHNFPKWLLYSQLFSISQTIQVRWTWYAGDCCKSKDKLLWTLTHGRTSISWYRKKSLDSSALYEHWMLSRRLNKNDDQ